MSNNFKKDFLKSGMISLIKIRLLGIPFLLIILGLGIVFLLSGFKYLYPISVAVILLMGTYLYLFFKIEKKNKKEQDEIISKNLPQDKAEKLIKITTNVRKVVWTVFWVVIIYLLYLLFRVFYIFFN